MLLVLGDQGAIGNPWLAGGRDCQTVQSQFVLLLSSIAG